MQEYEHSRILRGKGEWKKGLDRGGGLGSACEPSVSSGESVFFSTFVGVICGVAYGGSGLIASE